MSKAAAKKSGGLLDREIETYETHKAELLVKAEGKYVLIKGDAILDIFASEEDAIHRGYERLGNVPFLVKHIIEFEQPLRFTSFPVGG
jgi:hypothetical protein